MGIFHPFCGYRFLLFVTVITFLSSFVVAGEDITKGELEAEGVSPDLIEKIMALPPERRIELKKELDDIRAWIAESGDDWSAGWNPKFILSDEEREKNIGGGIASVTRFRIHVK